MTTLVERLTSGKIACPRLEPVLSHRPMTLEEWREAGTEAASTIESQSERIAVLEGAADHLLHRVPIEPGMNSEPFERLSAALYPKHPR